MDIIPEDVEPLIFKCLGYHDLTFCKSALEYRDATADKAARKIQNLLICWNNRRKALEQKMILNRDIIPSQLVSIIRLPLASEPLKFLNIFEKTQFVCITELSSSQIYLGENPSASMVIRNTASEPKLTITNIF